jgi:hypothetical protein
MVKRCPSSFIIQLGGMERECQGHLMEMAITPCSGIYICFQEEKTLTYYFLSLDITVSHSSEMLTMGP